jgi:2-oxoisovalerate dehydrogenase E1 component
MQVQPSLASAPDLMLPLYRRMLLIRRCEEALVRLYAAGKFMGACHTYIGEEAVAAGVCAHLTAEDTVFSTHRGHGHALAKGVPPRELIAELLGKATGCSGGRGGSMHLFRPDVGFMGSSGIVGPSITLAAGAAYSARALGTGRVSVAFFGDGAANNGSFHEGLNLAAAWRLPVIFVCENNLYATEIAFSTVSRSPGIAARAAGYGLPGLAVDGNDVLAVHAAAGEAVRRARAGEGPTLLECLTYRLRPHSEGMRDSGYRTAGEVAAWHERDPLKRLTAALLAAGMEAGELERVDGEVKAVVAEAVRYAEDSPYPDPQTVPAHLYSDDYAGSTSSFLTREGTQGVRSHA